MTPQPPRTALIALVTILLMVPIASAQCDNLTGPALCNILMNQTPKPAIEQTQISIIKPIQTLSGINLNYHQESTWQQNSPLEYRPKQMDKLYLGKTYDLSGVTGISYYYAHWNLWQNANNNCNPDKIIDIRYYRTLTDPRSVYFDPKKWSAGDWYYWDGDECNLTHWDPVLKQRIKATAPLQQDNKFAFTLIKSPANPKIQKYPLNIQPLEKYQSVFEQI